MAKQIAAAFVVVIVFVVLGAHLLTTIDKTPFFGDESLKLSKARAGYLLAAGKFDDPYWFTEGYDIPAFVAYTYAGVAMASHVHPDDLPVGYDFNLDDEINELMGNIPAPVLLRRCRIASTLMGVLACGALMLVTWRLAGPLAAIVCGLLVALNPLYADSVHRAMGEGATCMWLAASWWLSVRYATALRRDARRSVWPLAVALGVAVAMAAMSKLTGGVAIVGAVGAALVALPHARGRAVGTLAVVVLVAGALFTAQSPVTWKTPIVGAQRMMNYRANMASIQQGEYPGEALFDVSSRARAFADTLWHTYGTLDGLGHWAAAVRLGAWLVVLGVAGLLVGLIRRLHRSSADAWLALVWVAALVAPVVLYLPLNWPRYFLPPMLACTVLQACAIGWAARRLLSLRAPSPNPAEADDQPPVEDQAAVPSASA